MRPIGEPVLPQPPPLTRVVHSVLNDNLLVTWYGNPHTARMGVLGRYKGKELAAKLRQQAREYSLLLFLSHHPGQVFTHDQLMDSVWQFTFYTDTSTVPVHIRRLRAKIEEKPSEPRWLQTVWGVGYRFQP